MPATAYATTAARLDRIRRSQGLSIRAAASRARLPYTTAWAVLRGTATPRPKNVALMVVALETDFDLVAR